jgi:hypothetical protein
MFYTLFLGDNPQETKCKQKNYKVGSSETTRET